MEQLGCQPAEHRSCKGRLSWADRRRPTGPAARFPGGPTRSLPARRAGVGLNLTSFNRCNLPPWAIASRDFDENPRPLEVQGVREENRFLFDLLEPDRRPRRARPALRRLDERALPAPPVAGPGDGRRAPQPPERLPALPARLGRRLQLGGGGGAEGLGGEPHGHSPHLPPRAARRRRVAPPGSATSPTGRAATPGRAPSTPSSTWSTRTPSTSSRAAIPGSAGSPCGAARTGSRTTTWWRRSGRREWVLRMNNLCSFTDDPERAWEFGDAVCEARLAMPRVFFAGHFLPRSVLRGERECLWWAARSGCGGCSPRPAPSPAAPRGRAATGPPAVRRATPPPPAPRGRAA